MEWIEVCGEKPLRGEVKVQGSKNAVLPILAAVLLADGTTVLHNCPDISDVTGMSQLLTEAGCTVSRSGDTLVIDTGNASCCHIKAARAGMMRSSILLLGSMLGKYGTVQLPQPGGCVIGSRPVDLHQQALEKLGVSFSFENGIISGSTKKLIGTEIHLPIPSVGATENIILAAVMAKGTTRLTGAAREPEIEELCQFLCRMGAVIHRKLPSEIVIEGEHPLHACEYEIPPDRIVAGTYMLAAAGTRGEITLHNMPARQLVALEMQLMKMGASFTRCASDMKLCCRKAVCGVKHLTTQPYPFFPTDLQSQMIAALTKSDCVSRVEETVFEARFKAVSELNKMGADIRIEGKTAVIQPATALHGCEIKAQELRGGAALVIAGLMAEGTTIITGCEHIDRGYEDICRDLCELGADIRKR